MHKFIQARFYQPSGQYATVRLVFAAEDISDMAKQWKAFAAGWEVAGKGRCLWDSIQCSKGESFECCYYIPEDTAKLTSYLEQYSDN